MEVESWVSSVPRKKRIFIDAYLTPIYFLKLQPVAHYLKTRKWLIIKYFHKFDRLPLSHIGVGSDQFWRCQSGLLYEKRPGVVLIGAVIGPGIPRLRSLGDAAEYPHVLRPPVDLLMVAPDDFHVCVWKDFHPDGFPLEAIVSIPGAFNRRIIHKFSYGAKLVLSRCRQKIPPWWTASAIRKPHITLILIETLAILNLLKEAFK